MQFIFLIQPCFYFYQREKWMSNTLEKRFFADGSVKNSRLSCVKLCAFDPANEAMANFGGTIRHEVEHPPSYLHLQPSLRTQVLFRAHLTMRLSQPAQPPRVVLLLSSRELSSLHHP